MNWIYFLWCKHFLKHHYSSPLVRILLTHTPEVVSKIPPKYHFMYLNWKLEKIAFLYHVDIPECVYFILFLSHLIPKMHCVIARWDWCIMGKLQRTMIEAMKSHGSLRNRLIWSLLETSHNICNWPDPKTPFGLYFPDGNIQFWGESIFWIKGWIFFSNSNFCKINYKNLTNPIRKLKHTISN